MMQVSDRCAVQSLLMHKSTALDNDDDSKHACMPVGQDKKQLQEASCSQGVQDLKVKCMVGQG